MIHFEEITNANIWKVCMLEPFDEQKDFVAENIQSLAEAYATRNEGNNALPLAVYRAVSYTHLTLPTTPYV